MSGMTRYRESAAGMEPEGKMRVGFHIELNKNALSGGSMRHDNEIARAVGEFEMQLRAFVTQELRADRSTRHDVPKPGSMSDAFAPRRPASRDIDHVQRVVFFLENVRGAIRIPAGTRARQCHGRTCTDMIFDVVQKAGARPTPVSVKQYKDNPIGIPPTDTEDGAGINHFADCPDAPQFRGKK